MSILICEKCNQELDPKTLIANNVYNCPKCGLVEPLTDITSIYKEVITVKIPNEVENVSLKEGSDLRDIKIPDEVENVTPTEASSFRAVKIPKDAINITPKQDAYNEERSTYLDVCMEQTALLLKEYYISVSVKKMMEDRLAAFTRRRDGLRLFLFDMEELSRELRDLKDYTAMAKEAKAQYDAEKNTDIYYKIIAEVTDSLLMTTNCRTESQFPELEKIIKSCTGTLTSKNVLYINGNALLPKEQQHKNLSYIGLAKILREECKRLYGEAAI